MNEDLQHLKLLSLFHYIVGGFSALFSCMFLIHVAIGLGFVLSPETMANAQGGPPPAFVGYLFLGMGTIGFFLGQSLSFCIIYSGRLLKKRQRHLFSFVVACLECFFMPFGTVLGVLTIVVLSRDSVKRLYGVLPPAPQAPRAMPPFL